MLFQSESESTTMRILLPLVWTRRNSKHWTVIVFVVLFWLAQSSFSQDSPPSVLTVSGVVKSSSGEPIADVALSLQENGQSSAILTKTNTDGSFTFSVPRAGPYILKAQKTGWHDSLRDNLMLSGERTEVNLTLEKDSTSSGMEFSDQPNFTVAGVTDSSQAGGHGSDAGARTSDALARQAVALKADAGGPADRFIADDIKGRTPVGTENELRSALANSPRSFEANRNLGELYFLLGRYREAIPQLEAAIQIKPDDYSSSYDLALSYRANGDYAKARELIRKMLGNTDRAQLHSLMGNLNEQMADPLNAVREYEQAVRMDPSEQNYFEWGTELLLHRAVPPATEVFSRGSSLYRDSVRMLAGLGAALYAGGFYDQAASRVCQASDLRPNDPDPYLFLGKMEETAQAPLPCVEEKMVRFLQLHPNEAMANYYYATTLLKRAKESGDPSIAQPAETLLRKALAIDPKLGQAYLQLGTFYAGRGDSAQAISAYQEAIDVSPELSEAHYRLGVAYQRIGEQTKARQEFQTQRQMAKNEAADAERQRREVQQFLIVLKDQPAAPQK